MKNFLILLSVTLSFQVYAQQTGINTKNPQGPFHVDANKDNNANGAPTVAQQGNDFIVTIDGFVGIGTIFPTHKLDIRGKIQIRDGRELAGSVLTTDANGQAVWNNPAINRPLVNGTFPSSDPGTIRPDGGTTPIYSRVSITLGRGKWIVNAGVTFTLGNATIFQRCYLSSSTTALQQNGFAFFGPAGAQTSYGGVLVYPVSDRGVLGQLGFVTGSMLIEVTQPSVTIYLLLQNQPFGAYTFNPKTYLENYFFARPID